MARMKYILSAVAAVFAITGSTYVISVESVSYPSILERSFSVSSEMRRINRHINPSYISDLFQQRKQEISGRVREISNVSDAVLNSLFSGGRRLPIRPLSELDVQLSSLSQALGLDEVIQISHLPSIHDPVAQLGMKLFFSKSLGGAFDSACVSCHHPVFGGADQLSLPVGVGAKVPELLGRGRTHQAGLPLVPRNSPTVFNLGLWDTSLFWDSRVESLGQEPNSNGATSRISTPDSGFGRADQGAGENLSMAQANFPVTSSEEMRTHEFGEDLSNHELRERLAARIGNYADGSGELEKNDWLLEFQQVYGSTEGAESLITYSRIAKALGEYERSMVFIDSPWRQYLQGDKSALSVKARKGAVLFFTEVDKGGAGCVSCHFGKLFSDGQHHVIAQPQVGIGKGDGETKDDDFGRERVTGNSHHRYQFRTPSLLNIDQTAPYGHAGAFDTLEDVVRHYVDPTQSVASYFARGGICSTEQFAEVPDCSALYPNNQINSEKAVAKLEANRVAGESLFLSPDLNEQQIHQVVAFLRSLTDPCVKERECLSDWIPDNQDSGVDGQQLNAVNKQGDLL